ncbi:innexin inx2-like [Ischnura elegans]|uniref:innexin inx2-like n=1 Tax=Ischnura elegans TaxID=197161 RepID=UPI001ED8BCA9|nr:innexin inx2-like [Ischnura elegans]
MDPKEKVSAEELSRSGVTQKTHPGLPHHPGVKPVPYNSSSPFQFIERVEYQKYYQWVGFVLILQAVLFYVPFYLWNLWEGGRIRSLVLSVSQPVVEMGEGDESPQRTVEPVVKSLIMYWEHHLHYHDSYAFRYALFGEVHLPQLRSNWDDSEH